MQIDHDPHEGKKFPDWHKHLRPDSEYSRRAKASDQPFLYPVLAAILAFLWWWYFTYQTPHWVSVGIGFVTGMMVMAWAADKLDNRPADKSPSHSDSETPDV